MDRPNILKYMEDVFKPDCKDGLVVNLRNIEAKEILDYIHYLETKTDNKDTQTIKIDVEVEGLEEVKELSESIDKQNDILKTILGCERDIQFISVDKEGICINFNQK